MMEITADIIARARRRSRRAKIILPESAHSGILSAAARACRDNIADCILLGETHQIQQRAAAAIELPPSLITMMPPVDKLAPALARLRAHKGMDEAQAIARLQEDAVAAAAMMTREKYADGMVAGAQTTSATVLRAALQIIGKEKNAPLASSFFIMDMPSYPMIFADCAMNPRHTPEETAFIAKQSADSARLFGIAPVVAMLSYATGAADGEAARKTEEATNIARRLMPDIPVMGPIQYDAAVSARIGAIKAPQWKEAGRANVLIFPDLAAGNIAYKVAQQTAGVVAIGPLTQGLAMPANDLSRGATEEDIYYTIAATALQCAC